MWAAEPSDPEYMDCYSDRKEDRVMSQMYVDPDMTQSACRSHCEGYMYYGLQVGGPWGGGGEGGPRRSPMGFPFFNKNPLRP